MSLLLSPSHLLKADLLLLGELGSAAILRYVFLLFMEEVYHPDGQSVDTGLKLADLLVFLPSQREVVHVVASWNFD